MDLNESYWTNRYKNNQLGWDIGYPSPPIISFMKNSANKEAKILIPGCGNAYEATYLWENGFKNVFLLDISPLPLKRFAEDNPEFPSNQLLNIDFFDLADKFDYVLEQTFFCALNPNLREKYAKQMVKLLKTSGLLVGLLFNIPLFEDRPPFGGSKKDYERLFKKYFSIEKMEPARNSIPERQGSELFIKMNPLS